MEAQQQVKQIWAGLRVFVCLVMCVSVVSVCLCQCVWGLITPPLCHRLMKLICRVANEFTEENLHNES